MRSGQFCFTEPEVQLISASLTKEPTVHIVVSDEVGETLRQGVSAPEEMVAWKFVTFAVFLQ